MHAILLFTLVLWTTIAVVSGTMLHSVGDWVLSGGQIVCVGEAFCDYYFVISSNGGGGDGTANTTHHRCHFQVESEEGVPADAMQFQDVGCDGGVANDTFRVNGSWEEKEESDRPDIVLCVTNVVDRVWAFFGFDDWEIQHGRVADNKSSPVYPVGTFEKRQLEPRKMDWVMGKHTSTSAPDQCIWSIQWLNRYVGDSSMKVHFSFLNEYRTQHICTVNASAPAGADPKTWSFYQHKCDENDWSVSWGYQAAGDAAVLTLHNPGCDRRSWFGWNDVNSGVHLHSAGPNAAEAYC
ncbi:hypothetical protein DL770_009801 [Monosporascus sp. CRB-9-2]|nr:hypothetical protein DL770_009801 [Monosporascus sp. CRB-9-2]